MVLSMSKRIMMEPTSLVEDLGSRTAYTDTDSMVMPRAIVPALSKAFEEKYGRKMCGDDQQQFNNDFAIKDGEGNKICTDVYATQCSFNMKKTWAARLVGTRKTDGEQQGGDHFRMKGVGSKAILAKIGPPHSKDDVEHLDCGVMELYRTHLHDRDGVTFDLLATPDDEAMGCSFKYHPDFSIESRGRKGQDRFTRTVRMVTSEPACTATSPHKN
jgi:hypothetical protein